MKIVYTLKIIALSLLLSVGLSACDKPGPAEKTGKKIDQTVDKVGDKISDTVDKVDEKIHEKSK